MKHRAQASGDDSSLGRELRRQLDVVRGEDTPERLLSLARQLQDLLRERQPPE